MKIGELAKRSGLTAYTIRYYERIGLLPYADRNQSRHRDYDATILTWIEFLGRLKTASDGAVSVGERIRDRLAAHRFLEGDGLSIALTASVGVATLPDVAATAEELIQAADEAMYWVKSHGKNGIHVAGA